MNRIQRFRFAVLIAVLCLLAASIQAQSGGKKSYTFHGKVTAVDASAKRLTVANEKIEGWMDAMTMGYAVDNDDVFKRVKAGDQITAKVYDGDYTLHEVQVVPLKDDKKK
jgi:Cu/Ag efflux protein CusF